MDIVIACVAFVILIVAVAYIGHQFMSLDKKSEKREKQKDESVEAVWIDHTLYVVDKEVAKHIRCLASNVEFWKKANLEKQGHCLSLTQHLNDLEQELAQAKDAEEDLRCELDKYKALYRSVNDEATALYIENLTLKKQGE